MPLLCNGNINGNMNTVESVKIRNFPGPYFPAFELNTERYSVSLLIQSECGKMQVRKNSVFGQFSHSIPTFMLTALPSVDN